MTKTATPDLLTRRMHASRCETLALALIKYRHERGEPGLYLWYHDREHTRGVVDRTVRVLNECAFLGGMDPTWIELGRIAAAFHDTVQRWERYVDPQGRLVRRRLIGRNEAESSNEAVAAMRDANRAMAALGLPPIFGKEDTCLIREAIDATVPEFRDGRLLQPNLTSACSPVTFALCLADLGEHGMTVDGFLRAGDAAFREDRLGLELALLDPSAITPPMREEFREDMISWSATQVAFARNVHGDMPRYLEGLPGGACFAVQRLFPYFLESIAAAETRRVRRERMSFDDLLRDFGYRPRS